MENKLINKIREGTQKKELIVSLILFFLIIISILPLTSAQPSYIYGPTGPIAAVDNDYTHYFITDGEGSVVRTINETGDVIKAREYEPDGKNFFKNEKFK